MFRHFGACPHDGLIPQQQTSVRALAYNPIGDPQVEIAGETMDGRVEAFLADVLALAGEEANAIRQGVRGALTDYEREKSINE